LGYVFFMASARVLSKYCSGLSVQIPRWSMLGFPGWKGIWFWVVFCFSIDDVELSILYFCFVIFVFCGYFLVVGNVFSMVLLLVGFCVFL